MSAGKASKKFQKELNAGAVSLVLLSILRKQGEAMYGYEIARQLESLAGGALPMNQGAVYPVLRSLERQGLLRSRMIPSDAGPPRKYYQLTTAGRRSLTQWQAVWRRTKQFVELVLEHSDEHDPATTDSKISGSIRA